jgi:hypothetical protein
MRKPTIDFDDLIDLNCTPDLDPERQAEARQMLHAVFGPHADALLRACGRAAAGQRELNELRELLDDSAHAPQLCGVVTGLTAGHVRLWLGGAERLLPRPDGMALGIGQTVLTDAAARRVQAAAEYLVGGRTYVFCERFDRGYALVRPLHDGPHTELRQLALLADCVDTESLSPGDRVLGWSFDQGNIVLITRRLGAAEPLVADDDGGGRRVTRADIVGLDEIIAEAEMLFLSPQLPEYVRLLARANRALVGLVFHGPAGCGKSTVAEYFAGEVRERGGRTLYRTASHYLSKWVGHGAALLRADFAALDAAFADTGVRPLLVIDELEAIAVDRSHAFALAGGHLDVLDTLLSILTRTEVRMIGISNVTNRVLDTALLRDGRLRVVPFPATVGPEQLATLVAQCLAGVRLAHDGNGARRHAAQAFGDAISDMIFAPAGALGELLRVQLADGRVMVFGARDLSTPAAIADGIVGPTLARLAQRDLRAGRPAPSALGLEELRDATVAYFARRCATITRDNVRGVLPERIPEDLAVVKVEPVQGAPSASSARGG